VRELLTISKQTQLGKSLLGFSRSFVWNGNLCISVIVNNYPEKEIILVTFKNQFFL